jgi:hypothetical protein
MISYEMKRLEEEKELSQCTFQPRINYNIDESILRGEVNSDEIKGYRVIIAIIYNNITEHYRKITKSSNGKKSAQAGKRKVKNNDSLFKISESQEEKIMKK